MKIAIFGASGQTGKLLVSGALQAGHEVRAFVRTASRLVVRHERLEVVRGDVLDAAAVDRAVADREAVISALGVGMGSHLPVLSQGARNVVEAMERHRVPRLIWLSSYGSGRNGDGASLRFRLALFLGPRRAYADKRLQDDVIRKSRLAWVIARPTLLTDGPARGRYRVAERMQLDTSSRISRADVANFLLTQLTDDRWIGKYPLLSD